MLGLDPRSIMLVLVWPLPVGEELMDDLVARADAALYRAQKALCGMATARAHCRRQSLQHRHRLRHADAGIRDRDSVQ